MVYTHVRMYVYICMYSVIIRLFMLQRDIRKKKKSTDSISGLFPQYLNPGNTQICFFFLFQLFPIVTTHRNIFKSAKKQRNIHTFLQLYTSHPFSSPPFPSPFCKTLYIIFMYVYIHTHIYPYINMIYYYPKRKLQNNFFPLSFVLLP